MIPKDAADKCTVKSVSLKWGRCNAVMCRDHENKGSISFDVQTTGIHYIIAVTFEFSL